MNRKETYSRTSEYLSKNWMSVAIVAVAIWAVNALIGLVFGAGVLMGLIKGLATGDMESLLRSVSAAAGQGFLIAIVTNFISIILNGGFAITVLNGVKHGKDVSISSLIDAIQEHLVAILISSLAITAIVTIGGMVPFLGWIIKLFLTYSFAFTIFYIGNNDTEDAIDALKLSWAGTSGYRLNILLLELRYALIPFGILIGGFILSLVFMKIKFLSTILLIATILGFIVANIYYMPFAMTAKAVLFTQAEEA